MKHIKESTQWIGLVILALVAGFISGSFYTHADLLAQCKGPEKGIHLQVLEKRYFYYCSYVQPQGSR